MADLRNLRQGPAQALNTEILVIAGQSNAAGTGDVADLTHPLNGPQPDVLYWDLEQWIALQPGYGVGAHLPGDHFGPELSLGREVRKRRPLDLRIVKGTAGGSSLAVDWNPLGGPLFPLLRQVVFDAALHVTPPGRKMKVAGFFWMQGEEDATDGAFADAYETNLTALVAQARADFLNPTLPFVIGRISAHLPDEFPFKETVRAAQDHVASSDPHVHLVDTDGFSLKNDQIHFDSAGVLALGSAMASAFLADVGSMPLARGAGTG